MFRKISFYTSFKTANTRKDCIYPIYETASSDFMFNVSNIHKSMPFERCSWICGQCFQKDLKMIFIQKKLNRSQLEPYKNIRFDEVNLFPVSNFSIITILGDDRLKPLRDCRADKIFNGILEHKSFKRHFLFKFNIQATAGH